MKNTLVNRFSIVQCMYMLRIFERVFIRSFIFEFTSFIMELKNEQYNFY